MALLFVRHGSTGANAGDNDPSQGFGDKDYFRGWSNIPLSPKGNKAVKQTAEWFAKNQIKVDGILSSDLHRAQETANEISKAINVPVQTDPRLRPLNIGSLTGLEITPDKEKILEAAHKNTDMTIPGGESYKQFTDRYSDILKQLLPLGQQKNYIIVTHHRNLLALPHLFFGVTEPPVKGPPVPGGVVVLGNKRLEVLFEPSGQEKYTEKAKS